MDICASFITAAVLGSVPQPINCNTSSHVLAHFYLFSLRIQYGKD